MVFDKICILYHYILITMILPKHHFSDIKWQLYKEVPMLVVRTSSKSILSVSNMQCKCDRQYNLRSCFRDTFPCYKSESKWEWGGWVNLQYSSWLVHLFYNSLVSTPTLSNVHQLVPWGNRSSVMQGVQHGFITRKAQSNNTTQHIGMLHCKHTQVNIIRSSR